MALARHSRTPRRHSAPRVPHASVLRVGGAGQHNLVAPGQGPRHLSLDSACSGGGIYPACPEQGRGKRSRGTPLSFSARVAAGLSRHSVILSPDESCRDEEPLCSSDVAPGRGCPTRRFHAWGVLHLLFLPTVCGHNASRKIMYDDAHRLVGIVPRGRLVSTILNTSLSSAIWLRKPSPS